MDTDISQGEQQAVFSGREIFSEEKIEAVAEKGPSANEVFQKYDVDARSLMKDHMRMDDEMVESNMKLLEETEMTIEEDEISGIKVTWVVEKGKPFPETIKAQYETMINRAGQKDPEELKALGENGLVVIDIPQESGINRPFIKDNVIFNYSQGSQAQIASRNAHEFSHSISYGIEVDGNKAGHSPSAAISEGTAVYLTEDTYYTREDDPTTRSRDVRVQDAIFFDKSRMESARDMLAGKGESVLPSSPSAMREHIVGSGEKPFFNEAYVYGSAVIGTVSRISQERSIDTRGAVKQMFATSTQETTQAESREIPESLFSQTGLTPDTETRLIVHSISKTTGISDEQAAIEYKKGIDSIFA